MQIHPASSQPCACIWKRCQTLSRKPESVPLGCVAWTACHLHVYPSSVITDLLMISKYCRFFSPVTMTAWHLLLAEYIGIHFWLKKPLRFPTFGRISTSCVWGLTAIFHRARSKSLSWAKSSLNLCSTGMQTYYSNPHRVSGVRGPKHYSRTSIVLKSRTTSGEKPK